MLSLEEIEDTYSRMRLRPPSEIVMLDGIIDMDGVAIGATKLLNEDAIIITPLSTKSTLVHEVVHKRLKFGEILTPRVANFILSRLDSRPKIREVKYQEDPMSREEADEILRRFGLALADEGVPKLKRYVLVRTI